VNGVAGMELGRGGRGGKAMRLTGKYWERMTYTDIQDPVRLYYEWKTGNTKVQSWANNVKKEL
jgi:hypothetical protein